MRQRIIGVLVGALALAGVAAVPAAATSTGTGTAALACSVADWCTDGNSARAWPLYTNTGIEAATAIVAVQRKTGSTGIVYVRPYTRVHQNCYNGCFSGVYTRSVQAGSTDSTDRVRLGSTEGGPALEYAPVVNADAYAGEGLDATTWGAAYPVQAWDQPYGWTYSAFTTGQASVRLVSGELIVLHTRSYDSPRIYTF